MKLGDTFPNFQAETNNGPIDFYQWQGQSWAILFSHPADYTPVCTTELAAMAYLAKQFRPRGVKLIALSCDSVESHKGFMRDLEEFSSCLPGDFPYSIIADPNRELAVQFGMLDAEEKDKAGLPLTARVVYVIGPDRKVKALTVYPVTVGRNTQELVRLIDALQLAAKYNVVTPANWEQGGKVIVPPTVTNGELKERYPLGVEVHTMPSGKEYLRWTPQPDISRIGS